MGLADNVDSVAARDVVDVLIEMYLKNFYNYLNIDDMYFEDIIAMVRDDFDTGNSLRWLVSQLELKLSRTVTKKQLAAVNVCTIHATKGLEFDRVYLMSMAADDRQFNSQVELRLYYVGSTRQRKSLVLSVDEQNPHPLTAPEYIVAPAVEIENRFDINPATNFNGLFDNHDNPNIRRNLT
jgi:superfamily I DNA/RNA helicase